MQLRAKLCAENVEPREALIKAGLMQLQFKICEFKAKIASNSTAIAKIFNAEITHFGCRGANHALISAFPGSNTWI